MVTIENATPLLASYKEVPPPPRGEGLQQRTSQQGETELPPQSTNLKSESDFFYIAFFWRIFRVSCHARWETKLRWPRRVPHAN